MRFRYRIEYVTYRVGSWLMRKLPLALAQGLARVVARGVYAIKGRQALSTRENLRVMLPDRDLAERGRIARASYEHVAWNAVDFARAERWTVDELREHVSFEGYEHYQAARRHGKGLFFLSLHMGNFELLVQRAIVEGIEAMVIGRPMKNPLLYKHVRASRQATGAELIDRDNAVPVMLRALRKNRGVAVLNDQYLSPARGGVFVPFFGIRASTAPAVPLLAVRTGAAIVPAYCFRDRPDHHVARLLPALEFPITGNRAKDVEAAAVACNEALEQIILRHPEQWMWGNRRFRHSPDLAGTGYEHRVGRAPRG